MESNYKFLIKTILFWCKIKHARGFKPVDHSQHPEQVMLRNTYCCSKKKVQTEQSENGNILKMKRGIGKSLNVNLNTVITSTYAMPKTGSGVAKCETKWHAWGPERLPARFPQKRWKEFLYVTHTEILYLGICDRYYAIDKSLRLVSCSAILYQKIFLE